MREAYVSLCDLLVGFGRQLRACGQLGALVYLPDPSLQQALQVNNCLCGEGSVGPLLHMCATVSSQDYVLVEVIEGGGEEEDSEPSSEAEAVAMAEKLNDRRVQLAGFLKLVLFGVLDMSMAAPVFAQYVKVSACIPSFSPSLSWSILLAHIP